MDFNIEHSASDARNSCSSENARVAWLRSGNIQLKGKHIILDKCAKGKILRLSKAFGGVVFLKRVTRRCPSNGFQLIDGKPFAHPVG